VQSSSSHTVDIANWAFLEINFKTWHLCSQLAHPVQSASEVNMRNHRFSKAAILSIALTVGPAVLVAIPGASVAYAQETPSDISITLELFDQPPSDSSAPLSMADLTGGGDLGDLMAMDNAAQGRYLRVTVTQGDNTDMRLYRVLITPSNGRVFILSPQGVISLDNLLRQSGLRVAKDNVAVTMGTGTVELKVDGLNGTDSSTSTSTTTDTSTAVAMTTATDTSTTAAPADTSTAAAPADTSATAAAPADTSAASATPADTSASSTDSTAQPLTAAVTQDLGKLVLAVLPTSASAPDSSATNFYVLPYSDATDPTQGINSNVVTLDYTSAASLTDVAAYYDKLMADQGFTNLSSG
jgi:hypothetical protein